MDISNLQNIQECCPGIPNLYSTAAAFESLSVSNVENFIALLSESP
jgi:hypothetical protein